MLKLNDAPDEVDIVVVPESWVVFDTENVVPEWFIPPDVISTRGEEKILPLWLRMPESM